MLSTLLHPQRRTVGKDAKGYTWTHDSPESFLIRQVRRERYPEKATFWRFVYAYVRKCKKAIESAHHENRIRKIKRKRKRKRKRKGTRMIDRTRLWLPSCFVFLSSLRPVSTTLSLRPSSSPQRYLSLPGCSNIAVQRLDTLSAVLNSITGEGRSYLASLLISQERKRGDTEQSYIV